MHRFWFFPLFMGVCGGLYAVVSSGEGWLAYYVSRSSPIPFWFGDELYRTWQNSVMWGFFVGLIAGAVGAWNELLRRGVIDRSGLAASSRLYFNGFWIGLYVLVANGINGLVVAALLKTGIPWRMGMGGATIYRYWFPGIFSLGFGVMNFVAIAWTLWRTVEADDVLTPTVLLRRLRRSTTVTK